MPIREDVAANAVAPQAVRDLLLNVGGRNPFGEPNFRLCLASGIRKLQGAEWHTYRAGFTLRKKREGMFVDEDGNICINEKFQPIEPPEKPISSRVEMRWIKTYPMLKGWVLEEWHPAHKFGSPDEWSSYRVKSRNPDGTETIHNLNQLGPYPEHGKYMLCLPEGYPEVPPLNVLRVAINYVEACRAFWDKLTPDARRRLEEDSDLQRAALHEKREQDEQMQMVRDMMSPMLSTSLEAGRWREQLAKRRGLKIGHVGA